MINSKCNDTELIQKAIKAMEHSYSPYSHFSVGAAIMTESGNIYTGCNVENSSYGATICAERTAALKAISEGERKIEHIAIVSSSGDFTFPCGICRQFLSEFMPSEGRIILSDKNNNIKIYTLGELLPEAFMLNTKD